MSEKIILPSSPEAAQLKTIEVWVSRLGGVYENNALGERDARHMGATHRQCKNPQHPPTFKNLLCKICADDEKTRKYNEMEGKPWDGVLPICPIDGDEYFYDYDDLVDYLAGCITPEYPDLNSMKELITGLKLVHCKKNFFSEIDACDLFESDLRGLEEAEVPDELLNAVDGVNEIIRAQGHCSYSPSNVKIIFDDDDIEQMLVLVNDIIERAFK